MVAVVAPAPEEPKKERQFARGGAGNRITAGHLEDDDLAKEIRGEKWYGQPGQLGVGTQMMSDPHVRMALEIVTAPIRAAMWEVDPVSDSALDVEIADAVHWQFYEKLRWQEVLRTAAYAFRDGFANLEATWDACKIDAKRFPLHPGRGIGMAFTGFHHRPAWTLYRWGQSKANPTQVDWIEQWIVGSDGEKSGFRQIPADALLRFTHEQEGAYFAGRALTRSCFGPWKLKRIFQIILAIYNERQGAGVAVMELPPGVEKPEIELAEQICADIGSRERAYAILLDGMKFAWSTPGGSTQLNRDIEQCNRDIAFNSAGGFMLLSLGGDSTGSNALAQTQQGQYEIQLEGKALFLADTFNYGSDGWSPVERFVRWNYGPDVGIPRIVARNMPTRDWAKALPQINQSVQTGLIVNDDPLHKHVRKVMFLPKADPKTARPSAIPGANPQAQAGLPAGQTQPPPTAVDATQAGQQQEQQPVGGGPAPGGVVDENKVAERLNAAQAASIFEAIDKAAVGQLPRDTVVKTIAGAYLLDEGEVDQWVGKVGNGFEPKVTTLKVEDPAAKPAPAPAAPAVAPAPPAVKPVKNEPAKGGSDV